MDGWMDGWMDDADYDDENEYEVMAQCIMTDRNQIVGRKFFLHL
jgi:hypothetical protein